MFLEFYHLRQQPFGVTPDPAYLYRTRTHRDALDSLLSGIKEGRGFFALIAEPGMGKTTLLYQLLDELHDCARTVFVFQTQCDSREFFQYLLNELGVDTRGMDLVTMHSKLNEILFAEMIAGRRFVLIVDEAQNLEDSVLETVRLLSNFETSYAKMLQIVLAGQPELADKLARPELAQLRQRLAVVATLDPLSAAETANYIDHRLSVGGYSGGSLFDSDAVSLIAELSGGIPRTINLLCYNALSLGYSRGCETISAAIVHEVASRLGYAAQAIQEKTAELAESASTPAIEAGFIPDKAQEGDTALGRDAKSSFRLTYTPARRFRMPRWAFRTPVLAGVLALAGISLTAFMLRLTEPEAAKKVAPATITTSAPSPASASSKPLGQVPSAAQSGPGQSSNRAGYNADPEETGQTQIITVAAMPGQKIDDISRSYVGHFDADLLEQIRFLNPEIKDINHLTDGELIRLPLPRNSFKKGQDLDSNKE